MNITQIRLPYWKNIERTTRNDRNPDITQCDDTIPFVKYMEQVKNGKYTDKHYRPCVMPQRDINKRLTGFVLVDIDAKDTQGNKVPIDIPHHNFVELNNAVVVARSTSGMGYHLWLYYPELSLQYANSDRNTWKQHHFPNALSSAGVHTLIESTQKRYPELTISTNDFATDVQRLFITHDPAITPMEYKRWPLAPMHENNERSSPNEHFFESKLSETHHKLLYSLPEEFRDDYDLWFKVLVAYKCEYGDIIKEDMREWSKGSSKYHRKADNYRKTADEYFDIKWKQIPQGLRGSDSFTIDNLKLWSTKPFELESTMDKYITAEYTPPEFALCTPKGSPLIVEGQRTLIVGKRSALKSWFALLTAIEMHKRGHPIVWIDAESGPERTAYRLQTQEYTPTLTSWYIYGAAAIDNIPSIMKELEKYDKPAVLVLDSAVALGLTGDGSTNNDAYTMRKWRNTIEMFRQDNYRPTILIIWHAPKNSNEQDLSAVNSYASEAQADNVMTLWRIPKTRTCRIRCTKERDPVYKHIDTTYAKLQPSLQGPLEIIDYYDETSSEGIDATQDALYSSLYEMNGYCDSRKTLMRETCNRLKIDKISNVRFDGAAEALIDKGLIIENKIGNRKEYAIPDGFRDFEKLQQALHNVIEKEKVDASADDTPRS